LSSSANISADFGPLLAELEARLSEAAAAPLSRKKAMLVALLIDGFVDRLCAATGADDILVFRAGLAATSPALALVLALGAMSADGPRLAVETVDVPLTDYSALAVEDFMVSLYNDNTVQRVRIAEADGTRHDAHAVLRAAIAALRTAVSSAG
jgi:hypothetical protein